MKSNKRLLTAYLLSLIFLFLPFLSFFTRGNFLDLSELDLAAITQAIGVSLSTSLVGLLWVLLLGLPAGYFMARADFAGKGFLDLLFRLPQALPPAVIGLLFLLAYGQNGFIGRLLPGRLTFTSEAVVLIFIFVALPIFVNGAAAAFGGVDPRLEETAQVLGDNTRQVFWRVTLPLAKPGLLGAAMLSWSRGLSEFGATMMFAGNLAGITRTLPLAIYTILETSLESALFLAFIMFVISLALLSITHLLIERPGNHVRNQSQRKSISRLGH